MILKSRWNWIFILFVFSFISNCSCSHNRRLSVGLLLLDRSPGSVFSVLDRDGMKKAALEALSSFRDVDVDLGKKQKGNLRMRVDLDGEKLVVDLKYVKMSGDELVEYVGTGLASLDASKDPHDVFAKAFSSAMSEIVSSWKKDQKDSKSLKALCQALESEDAEEALLALESLGKSKDPSALLPIFNFAERKSPEVRRQAILAVRQIGGLKAAGWLFTLSTGYEDESVRMAASEALKEVEANLPKK